MGAENLISRTIRITTGLAILASMASCARAEKKQIVNVLPTTVPLEQLVGECDYVSGETSYMASGDEGALKLLECAWGKSFLNTRDGGFGGGYTDEQADTLFKEIEAGNWKNYPGAPIMIEYVDEFGDKQYIRISDTRSAKKFFGDNPEFRVGKQTTLTIGEEETIHLDGTTTTYGAELRGNSNWVYTITTEYGDSSQAPTIEDWN